jgi:biotin-dependent carboxylase-like uncharacterized protein
LLGNRPGVASLEVVLGGLELEVTASTWFVVTGAPVPIRIDDRDEPGGVVLAARPGQRVRLGVPTSGLRSYVAVRGGLDVPLVLGSCARDTLAGLGCPPIRANDGLPIGNGVEGDILVEGFPSPSYAAGPVLRVVPGRRADWVTDPDLLVRTRWLVGPASDRVGLRIAGATFTHTDPGRQLPSEGAVRGAIQVPPSGEPIIFGPDHPVTGGYPVVGVVVDKDTDRLAQLRPGETVRFVWLRES